jgi:hypothetical protein
MIFAIGNNINRSSRHVATRPFVVVAFDLYSESGCCRQRHEHMVEFDDASRFPVQVAAAANAMNPWLSRMV